MINVSIFLNIERLIKQGASTNTDNIPIRTPQMISPSMCYPQKIIHCRINLTMIQNDKKRLNLVLNSSLFSQHIGESCKNINNFIVIY